MSVPLFIGLTGGIGSGKSTVCKIFSDFNIPVIDADKITNKLLQPDQPGYHAAVRIFGKRIILESGELNRPLLRELVFSDYSLKKSLENSLHPLIFDEIRTWKSHVNAEYCIISIPLLAETNSKDIVDRVLLVDAPAELCIERAVDRDNSTREEIQKIISSQSTQSERRSIADDIITNDGDMKSLRKQVENLHDFYNKMASELRYKSTRNS